MAGTRRLGLIAVSTVVALSATSYGGVTGAPPLIDKDGDGLDDELEQRLLDAHRPVLCFDPCEIRWPCSITEFVTKCELVHNQASRVAYSQTELTANPLLALRGDERFSMGGPSSWADLPAKSGWRLKQVEAPKLNYGFNPGANGAEHRGMYGHVTPLDEGTILVQYWQFFPFNDAQFMSGAQSKWCKDGGDHEGDWVWLDMILLDRPPQYTVSVMWYHHHGDSHCAPTMVPCPNGVCPHPADVDLTGGDEPYVFVEAGTHEFWASASDGGECFFGEKVLWFKFGAWVAPHRGGGTTYRVPMVTNVGEVFAPMPSSAEADLFLLFNGTWGDWAWECFGRGGDPADPPLDQSTKSLPPSPGSPPPAPAFPRGPARVRCVDPKTDVRTTHGTPRFPYRTLAEAALGPDHVIEGGTVRARPGVYGEAIRIATPMTIRAWTD